MSKLNLPSMEEIIEDALSSRTDEELNKMREELQEAVNEISLLDPTLATKVKKMAEDFFFGVEDIRGYLRAKAESQEQQ